MLKRSEFYHNKKANYNVTLIILIISILYVNCDDQKTNAEDLVPPKLLLISFGGLRWDYLQKYNDLENFKYIKSIGSFSDYITGQFISEALPNQWSIVTGLDQKYHGMMQNEMYDREIKRKFEISSKKLSKIRSSNEWFGKNGSIEPIWITNLKAGNNRNSMAQWQGEEYLWGKEGAFRINYSKLPNYTELIHKIMKLFKRKKDPINFAAIYLDILDKIGHKYGPFSNEIKQEVHKLDKNFLGVLIKQLKSNQIFADTNLILTSDHGMHNVSKETTIILNKHIDTSLFEGIGGPVIVNLFFKNATDIEIVYEKIKTIKNLKLYRINEIPDEINFNKNSRTGDLVLIAQFGYSIYLDENSSINSKGARGYNGHNTSSMYSLFIAEGPAFKKNYEVDTFRNVDIYPLMCEILGIKPLANNGSLNIVKHMLHNWLTKKELDLYVFLSLLPVFLSFLTAIFLSISNKYNNKSSKRIDVNIEGYKVLLMKDNEDDLEMEDMDSDTSDETEFFNQT